MACPTLWLTEWVPEERESQGDEDQNVIIYLFKFLLIEIPLLFQNIHMNIASFSYELWIYKHNFSYNTI